MFIFHIFNLVFKKLGLILHASNNLQNIYVMIYLITKKFSNTYILYQNAIYLGHEK